MTETLGKTLGKTLRCQKAKMNSDFNPGKPNFTTSQPAKKSLRSTDLSEDQKQACKEIGQVLAKVGDDFDRILKHRRPVVVLSVITISDSKKVVRKE